MKVFIAQLLCPKRHCILALAGEGPDEDEFKKGLSELVWRTYSAGTFDPWCAICRAPAEDWTPEVAATGFASLAIAEPHLRQLERSQRATLEIIRQQRAKDKQN